METTENPGINNIKEWTGHNISTRVHVAEDSGLWQVLILLHHDNPDIKILILGSNPWHSEQIHSLLPSKKKSHKM